MFGLGTWEIILIVVVALVFIGPGKLPDVAKTIGKGLREFRRAMAGLEAEIPRDLTASAPAPAPPATEPSASEPVTPSPATPSPARRSRVGSPPAVPEAGPGDVTTIGADGFGFHATPRTPWERRIDEERAGATGARPAAAEGTREPDAPSAATAAAPPPDLAAPDETTAAAAPPVEVESSPRGAGPE